MKDDRFVELFGFIPIREYQFDTYRCAIDRVGIFVVQLAVFCDKPNSCLFHGYRY